MSTIGQRFKKIRTDKGLSQEAFGAKFNMSKSGISAVEKDKVFISVDVLRTLFFDFNISLNWLICGSGSMFNPPQFEDVKDEILKEVNKMLAERGL